MTIDKSLRRKGRLVRSRNVLKRGERIEQMKTEERWVEGRSPLGLPKTRVIKAAVGKKKKKAKAEEDGKEEGKAPAKGAAAKGAAPAKKAAPKK
ncbi:MAG TPA: small basic protein [Planctomycetaceae bacterium]|jgi:small basic protein (TIGR04137 family)|nr:small basic protein [Planctomycetaceae bacterium]